MAEHTLFPSISEREKADAATTEDLDGESDGDKTFRCGVNGCKRKVDDETSTCWQH